MATMKCPKCGRALDVTGIEQGASITCACGNVTSVTHGSSRRVLYIVLGAVAVLLACPCLGVVSAIAIPNFVRYQVRAKQMECRVNLKAWFSAQRAYQSDNNRLSPSLAVVGFVPERGNRYAYFAGEGPMSPREKDEATLAEAEVSLGVDTFKHPNLRPISIEDLPRDVAGRLGLSGECPKCDITLACAGNIDNDATLDVWMISTQDREDASGQLVPAGEPVNVVNDVTD